MEIYIQPEEYEEFLVLQKDLGLLRKNYIYIHGQGGSFGEWSPANLAELASCLTIAGYEVVLPYANEQKKFMVEIAELMSQKPRLFPCTSIGVISTFIKHSILTITNDSRVNEIAKSLIVPSLVMESKNSQNFNSIKMVKSAFELLQGNTITQKRPKIPWNPFKRFTIGKA